MMKTIKCSFLSEDKKITLTAVLTDDLTELSKSKQNQATDIITYDKEDNDEWSIYFDRQEQEHIELGYELVFRAKNGEQTLKPIKAITWVADVITDIQRLKVTVR